jgi:hypothetical protein
MKKPAATAKSLVPSEAELWLKEISAYDSAFKSWETRVDKILKRYRDDARRASGESAKFNILWSNVQTLTSAVYSRVPKPDVSRRFNDNDPVGRVAALLLERALDYEVQHYQDFQTMLRQSVVDRFLGGRGTAWVRYEPHMQAVEQELPTDGTQTTEDVDAPQEELDYECAPTDYVHWRDFGHSVVRTWDEVTKVWRCVYMTRDQLVARFGEEEGGKIPLDAKPEDAKKDSQLTNDRALIYEGWDKEKLEAVWISKSLGKFIDRRPDPLKLEGFWPCPRPLYATITNESLIPVPDFTLYQDQANELDVLCDRIDGLIKALRVRGVYDASIPELRRLFTEAGSNELIPVSNWQAFTEKNGLKGALDLVDIRPLAEALNQAYRAFGEVKGQVYDLTGISDIVRGQSVASETATAQQIKGQYASLRLKSYQDEVARFATECLQLKAQIICTKFQPQTILQMAAADQLTPEDQKLVPQAMALLVGAERMADPLNVEATNPLRSFRVEVAADSLVLIDQRAEQETATEFLTAIGGFLERGAQVAQQAPQIAPLIFDLMKFATAKFRAGRQIEGAIDAALDQVKQALAAPKPPAQPNPRDQAALMKAQTDSQVEPVRAQAEMMRAEADTITAGRELQEAQMTAAAQMPPALPLGGGM